MPKDISAFTQGKVAMIIVPSWQILEIISENPDLDIKVTQLPILPGSQPVSLATYWVEGVSKTSKHQEEAWKFLKFLSEKDQMTKLYQEQAKVRPFGVAYSRVDLRETLLDNEYIGPVLEQAPHMKSMPGAARTYDNGLNDEIIKYLGDAINATQKGVSYQQALEVAAQGVTQVLTKYKAN
jgi:ABC-type glycerol-3-phosphate transport system substrate-binding protein